MPDGPLPVEHELLVYAKSGYEQGLLDALWERYGSVLMRYGSYRRPRMIEAAYRTDKTVADDLARVFEAKECAVLGAALKAAA
jgi:hypothetical protein